MTRRHSPIALTCGDPAGIGPEIAYAAWQRLGERPPLFWIGDPTHLPSHARTVLIGRPSEAKEAAGQGLPVLAHPFPEPVSPGVPNCRNALAVIEVIRRAVDLAKCGEASAITTCPISKKVLIDGAGFAFPGHTEFLADLGGGAQVAMMLSCSGLRVVPATIHIPLSEVPLALTPSGLESTIRVTHRALEHDFGVAAPRIAVAGLNPHAGEGGVLGREDTDVIAPVLERLRAEGLALEGPLPADTMFHAAARDTYDAAVAMYHDQALIPAKTLDFAGGVNVTLGLPFVRTSPDHGTAFDIAGTGSADPTSLINALLMAADIAVARGAN